MARRYPQTVFISVGAILILLIFLNYLNILSPVKSATRKIFSPLSSRMNQLGIRLGEKYGFFTDHNKFLSDYADCQQKTGACQTTSARLKILEDENTELKKQLAFKVRNKIPIISANVIGRNMDSAEKTIIIDQGESAGIKIGNPVTIGDGLLVGKITKTERDVATVRLLNDSKSKIAATLLNKDRSLGVVEGGYGLSVRMGFIPRNESVSVGDLIVTSGLETEMPRGILLGQVVAVENEAYQPFQEAVLSPMADLSRLTVVSVLVTP